MYLLPRDGSKLSIAWTEDPSEHTAYWRRNWAERPLARYHTGRKPARRSPSARRRLGFRGANLFNSANSNRGELLSRCKEERLVGACSNLVCQSMRHSDCLSGVSAVAISKFENDRCSRRRNATPAPAARVIQLRPRWRTPTAPRPCISLQPSPPE